MASLVECFGTKGPIFCQKSSVERHTLSKESYILSKELCWARHTLSKESYILSKELYILSAHSIKRILYSVNKAPHSIDTLYQKSPIFCQKWWSHMQIALSSTKRAMSFITIALHSGKRALNSIKRAVSFVIIALHSGKRALYSIKRALSDRPVWSRRDGERETERQRDREIERQRERERERKREWESERARERVSESEREGERQRESEREREREREREI